MYNQIYMKYPASWHGDMWREGAPCGNGKIGALVYGGIYKEIILLNHAFLWHGAVNDILPDVSGVLPNIRNLLEQNNPFEADSVLTKALSEQNYKGSNAMPLPLCDINIKTPVKSCFANYKRNIFMDKAEVSVEWFENDIHFKRNTFVSRENDLVFINYTCDKGNFIDTEINISIHDRETIGNRNIKNITTEIIGSSIYYAAENDSVYFGGDYGAVCRIFTNGILTDNGFDIKIEKAGYILIVSSVFLGTERKEAFANADKILSCYFDYNEQLLLHTKKHSELFNKIDFSLYQSGNTCNEQLLLDAYENSSSLELIEKLYAYGRYLFICSTSDSNTLPCHLVGLWNGTYQCFWAIYMYNINFQMIYWQALSGNLPSFLRLALDYTENFIDDFRENAKKIFGCRGILINSVNTPESGIAKCTAPHIINWTGGAAWIAQHFWDYYKYTEDIVYLKEHALPFMYEAALFYEDFLFLDIDGYYVFSPSVSPENTALNVFLSTNKTREIETSKNSLLDAALFKELLTNLLSGCSLTEMYPDKIEIWNEMLKHIPPYRINEEDAICEWIDDFYTDNYNHRHHSHLYPVFPGCEISKNDPLINNFIIAEEIKMTKGLQEQSSWAMVLSSCIYARLGFGNKAFKNLDIIARTCLMNNFFTLHNDWRRMGPVSCNDFRISPFQIDANIGIPAAINEMLLQSQNDDIYILPALPEQWKNGKIEGLLARGNIICNIYWNEKNGYAEIYSKNDDKEKIIRLGSNYYFDSKKDFINIVIGKNTIIKFYKSE